MKVRISERKLKGIIRNAAKQYINENTSDEELIYNWCELRDILGERDFLKAIFDVLSDDELRDLVKRVARAEDFDDILDGYYEGDI